MVNSLLSREDMIVEERTGTPRVPEAPIIVINDFSDMGKLTYEQYTNAMPSEAMLAPFDEPIMYWEPVAPGCEVQWLPLVPGVHSSPEGLWRVRNSYEQALVRNRLSAFTGGSPDDLMVDTKEYQAAQRNPDKWMQCQNCPVRSTSVLAIKMHTRHWKHTIA